MTRSERMERVGAIAVVAVVLLVAVEAALYEAALVAFSHLDTPDCAGANTFCSPDGGPGPTGGAIVVAIGNAVLALGIAVTAAVLLRRRGRRP